uniref:Sodium:proton antiporter n=1 Tax=Thermorudis peleae TaxID=1382356 RepID=A0A831TD92_9BACT
MAQDILLVNLAFALIAGFIGAAIATRLGQSAIVGYILGGILIGPHTPGFVGNPEVVEALANIGIILLMFAVGVQISIDDLLRAGKIAIFGGLLQVIVTIALGYAIGFALGWSPLEAFVFGSVVSNSSSTVLSKILGDRGEMDTTHGRIGLAWSTVQDLSTVALVVIFSALAVEGNDLWTELLVAIGKAGLFLVILLPVGWKLLPWFFERVVGPQNREVFIVAVAAFALGTAYVSSFFGLSLALGAFVAGIVVSESDIWHQILDDIIPLRDLFIVLFFVSVGMLVDPAFIVRNIPLVLLGVASISVLKGMIVAAIMLLFRYPLGSSILTGIVLAQSAEFSLLLAREGAELGIVGSTLFNLMVSSVVLSIFLAPLLHLAGQPLIARIQQLLPASELSRLPALANPDSHLRGHAVIIGYGRVGGVIGEALRRRGFPFLVIDHDQGVVRVRQGADVLQPGDIAVHRKRAVGGDDDVARAVGPGLFELGLQIVHVGGGEAIAFGLAQPHPVDDRGMVQGVRDDRVLRPEQRFEDAAVGVEGGGEQDGVLEAQIVGGGPLQLLVNLQCAADEADRGRARAPFFLGLDAGLGDALVASKTQIVVGTEVQDVASADLDDRALA